MVLRTIRRAGMVLALGTALILPLVPAAAAPSAPPTPTVTGLVFADANSNGTSDSGEALAGLTLDLSGSESQQDFTTTTDGKGRFTVDVPLDDYYISGHADGWYVVPMFRTVPSAGLDLSLRAVRPLGRVLKVGLTFDKDSYAAGDDIHIIVTVTNTGSARLLGIGAECARVGDPSELYNTGPEWGPLRVSAPGLTLDPGQTRTVHVTTTVPDASRRAGSVYAGCDFGYPNVEAGVRPIASDSADVPGLKGLIDGDVRFYPHGHDKPSVGVQGVRLVLVKPSPSGCTEFSTEATTNAKGAFTLGPAPAGRGYQLYFFPPKGYRLTDENPRQAFVFGNDTLHFGFEVERGSATAPTIPADCESSPPGTSTPPASNPSSPPLAETGSNAGGLLVPGLAACLAGLLLVLLTRRRRHAH